MFNLINKLRRQTKVTKLKLKESHWGLEAKTMLITTLTTYDVFAQNEYFDK